MRESTGLLSASRGHQNLRKGQNLCRSLLALVLKTVSRMTKCLESPYKMSRLLDDYGKLTTLLDQKITKEGQGAYQLCSPLISA